MYTRKGHKDTIRPNYKYQFNSRQYDVSLTNNPFDSKIGATRAKEPPNITLPDKIKSNASFSVDKFTN